MPVGINLLAMHMLAVLGSNGCLLRELGMVMNVPIQVMSTKKATNFSRNTHPGMPLWLMVINSRVSDVHQNGISWGLLCLASEEPAPAASSQEGGIKPIGYDERGEGAKCSLQINMETRKGGPLKGVSWGDH